jgi:hypothetical protein
MVQKVSGIILFVTGSHRIQSVPYGTTAWFSYQTVVTLHFIPLPKCSCLPPYNSTTPTRSVIHNIVMCKTPHYNLVGPLILCSFVLRNEPIQHNTETKQNRHKARPPKH